MKFINVVGRKMARNGHKWPSYNIARIISNQSLFTGWSPLFVWFCRLFLTSKGLNSFFFAYPFYESPFFPHQFDNDIFYRQHLISNESLTFHYLNVQCVQCTYLPTSINIQNFVDLLIDSISNLNGSIFLTWKPIFRSLNLILYV